MNNLYSVYVCVYYGQASVEEQAAYWACPRSQYILIISLFFFNKKALQQCALFELDRGYVA